MDEAAGEAHHDGLVDVAVLGGVRRAPALPHVAGAPRVLQEVVRDALECQGLLLALLDVHEEA